MHNLCSTEHFPLLMRAVVIGFLISLPGTWDLTSWDDRSFLWSDALWDAAKWR
jgi:hypothetical protein